LKALRRSINQSAEARAIGGSSIFIDRLENNSRTRHSSSKPVGEEDASSIVDNSARMSSRAAIVTVSLARSVRSQNPQVRQLAKIT
jgi:hypothetical protein